MFKIFRLEINLETFTAKPCIIMKCLLNTVTLSFTVIKKVPSLSNFSFSILRISLSYDQLSRKAVNVIFASVLLMSSGKLKRLQGQYNQEDLQIWMISKRAIRQVKSVGNTSLHNVAGRDTG